MLHYWLTNAFSESRVKDLEAKTQKPLVNKQYFPTCRKNNQKLNFYKSLFYQEWYVINDWNQLLDSTSIYDLILPFVKTQQRDLIQMKQLLSNSCTEPAKILFFHFLKENSVLVLKYFFIQYLIGTRGQTNN